MSVSEILFALNGHYVSTGAYSFEFRKKRSGDRIAEIFFMLPPENVSVSETQFAEIAKTISGGYIADYGNSFKEINLSGQCHYYYVGTSKTAQARGRSFEVNPDDMIDGFAEYMKLRFMLMRYRDYTMTKDAKFFAPEFSLKDLADVNTLKAFVKDAIEDDGALADVVEVVWHDYDDDSHFKVKVESFVSDRTARDPWTVKYSIKMTGYEVDSGGDVAIRKPSAVKKTAPQQIRDVYLYTGNLSEDTRPDTLPVEVPDGVLDVPNQQVGVTLDPSAFSF